MKKTFNKPPLSIKEQINKLQKDYKIIINDFELAYQYLSHNSYYRLRGYWYFYEKVEQKNQITFQDIINLYEFDKKVRNIFVPYLEKIEISIKTNLVNYLGNTYNDPFVYLQKEIFKNKEHYEKFLQKIDETIKKHKDEPFIKHFYEKYNHQYPPIWMIMELLSFGETSKMYSNLNKKDLKNIANMYNLHPKCFINYIYHLTNVRNIIFHHMRFWNRTFSSVSPKCINFDKNYQGKLFLFHTTKIINSFLRIITKEEIDFEKLVFKLIQRCFLPKEYIYKYMMFHK